MAKDKASSLAIDFSKFTDEDLEAYEEGNLSVLSDKALEALADYEDKFAEISGKVGQYKEPEATPYGLTTAAAGTVGALATGIAPRSSQQLVDKALPEDLRGGYKAPAAAPVARPTVAPAPGADYFSPFGAGEGAVKNATHNVDEVLKNKVAQAAIKTPGYVAPGNSLILQPSSSLPTPAAPVAAPGSPVLPGAAKPKMGMPQMRAALQSPNVAPANRLSSSIKGGAAAGFGANAIEEARRGNYGDAATSAIGSGSSLAALASNPKLARAGKLGMAATILGKGYQSMQGREEKAMGGPVGYAKGKAVKGGLEAAKKLFDPRFDKRVLEQEKLANQVLKTEKTGAQNIPKIYLPDYEGYGMVTSMSDRTAGGSRLLGVNDVNFNRPVELTGGQEYMYNNPGQVWASGKNPVNQIMREAVAVKKATGKDPLYMPWRMAPTASDFAHMTGETMLTHAQSAMGKAQKKDLDNTIKKFIPDWSGIDDPESMQQFMVAPAKARKSIQNAIDRDLRGSGAMSIGETRLAIADPNQLTAPEGGLMHVGRISADKPVIEASGNITYPKGVPGEGMGQLDRDHFVTEFLPEFVKERRIADPRSPGQTDIRALQMKPYSGIIDDKLLKSLGYAEGGEVQGYSKGKAVQKLASNLILPPAENAARTQIIGTLPTYEKASGILQQRGAAGRGIDFGAGLGEGAKALGKDFDTYEPFAKNWTPTYSNAADVPSDAYGKLTNLNVLNVVPREIRDEIVQDIGRVMEPGGMGIITTRGKDVMNAKGLAGPEPMSIITSRDTYQKGFNKDELEEYLKYMLGDKFNINRLNLGPAGALIKKKAEGGLAQYKEGGSTSPAWQRKEGKNPEGGLNAAGRASYNRETGGNLKPPVSAEQAKKSPKSAARRKSFCARMSGNKGPMKDENGKPTRKALALRKWDC